MSYYRNSSGIWPYKTEIKGSVNALKHALPRVFSFWPGMHTIWSIENRESKNNLSRRRFSKTQWFNRKLNVLECLASMTKQFTPYFMLKFKFKDKSVRKTAVRMAEKSKNEALRCILKPVKAGTAALDLCNPFLKCSSYTFKVNSSLESLLSSR